jgi:hypothetical protein
MRIHWRKFMIVPEIMWKALAKQHQKTISVIASILMIVREIHTRKKLFVIARISQKKARHGF